MGLLALLAMMWRRHAQTQVEGRAAWLYPLLVFGGFGAIDILLKLVSQAGLSFPATMLAMFVLALVVAFGLLLWRIARGWTRFTRRSFVAGVLLGLLNFANIAFYLRGHQVLSKQPAQVFASMNLGVVALGALVGVLVFRERLSWINAAGVVLAGIAIAMIALA